MGKFEDPAVLAHVDEMRYATYVQSCGWYACLTSHLRKVATPDVPTVTVEKLAWAMAWTHLVVWNSVGFMLR
jgi:hypothetical protein